MVFPYLHRAERRIPLASLARPGHRLDIFNHHIGEGEHPPELRHHARFGFPAAAGGRRKAAMSREPILVAGRTTWSIRAFCVNLASNASRLSLSRARVQGPSTASRELAARS